MGNSKQPGFELKLDKRFKNLVFNFLTSGVSNFVIFLYADYRLVASQDHILGDRDSPDKLWVELDVVVHMARGIVHLQDHLRRIQAHIRHLRR